ncbi:MAG: twin-arginine translocase subunit TatC [Oligoflexus sp.]|jgi:sec-independent protein translocase protein TatC
MTDKKEDRAEQLKVMGLLEHIDELRSRVVKSILTIVVFFFICYSYADVILNVLRMPLVEVLPRGASSLHFTGPMDVFMANVKLGLFSALLLSCPVWLYQFWKFIEPALYAHERRYVLPFIASSVTLFVVGISFCFFVIIPLALKYLIGLGVEMGTTPIITISDYLSLLMLMMFGFGLIFETPVILILLALLDIITAETLSENRKFVIVGIFIISAILTPTPDPVSQIAMAGPTWLMFELSILIIRFIQKKKGASSTGGGDSHAA